MKKVIIIGCMVIGFILLLGKCNKSWSDKLYKDCKESGKQSQETCYKYSYLQ